jgi:hypothetical protein
MSERLVQPLTAALGTGPVLTSQHVDTQSRDYSRSLAEYRLPARPNTPPPWTGDLSSNDAFAREQKSLVETDPVSVASRGS